MKTALAIFVKTPELSPVKTRLAKGIGENNALKFYEFCLKKLQITASKAQSLSHNTIKPIWAVAETKGLNLQRWMNFERIYQGEGSLGERLHQVYSQLIQTHKSVIIIGSDSPQLKATDIVLASKQIKPAHFVVGPSEDGGFYLFASSTKLDKNDWLSINYSTNKTFD